MTDPDLVAKKLAVIERLGELRTNRELFAVLVRPGLLPVDWADEPGRMAGSPNRLDDLLACVRAVRARITP